MSRSSSGADSTALWNRAGGINACTGGRKGAMGRIRGKRKRDSDRYWHLRRKQTQAGMVARPLEASALCAKCGQLTPRESMHKGWCLSCVSEWVGTVDPWLIYQAQSQL